MVPRSNVRVDVVEIDLHIFWLDVIYDNVSFILDGEVVPLARELCDYYLIFFWHPLT